MKKHEEIAHHYYDGIGNHMRFNGIGTPIHYDSMGRMVNYVSLNGKFVRWIDEIGGKA